MVYLLRSVTCYCQIVEETKKSPEWLPAGWIVELKTRKSGSNAGLAYKVWKWKSTNLILVAMICYNTCLLYFF